MGVSVKALWQARASSGDAALAIDDRYSTGWISQPSQNAWLEIDLGGAAGLGGLEVYWGRHSAVVYDFDGSLDGETWFRLCGTRHGEGGQDLFAFPQTHARFIRWTSKDQAPEKDYEVVEFNLYDPAKAARILEADAGGILGRGPVVVTAGDSVTVDFGYMRFPLGALIAWGDAYGTVFSVHLSDDGRTFREMGRITAGNGDTDSFWWRSTTSRYFRLTVHEASSPKGSIINDIKLRLLNKDRMPIGELEKAARAGRAELYPQSLLDRQVFWTVIGEFGREEDALFDEYGNLEPRRGANQIMGLLRLEGRLHGASACAAVGQSLAEGSLPIPTVTWSVDEIELQASALATLGQAFVEYKVTNRSSRTRSGSLVLALHPVQTDPYWQHGGHAVIDSIRVDGTEIWVNDRVYAALSMAPEIVALVDFEDGDIMRLIEHSPRQTARSLRSASGLLCGVCEFPFSLRPGESTACVLAAPMRNDVTPSADVDFPSVREAIIRTWREKIGPRRIVVGDPEVNDTVEAQTALILVNATGVAFRPGPRNYDRTWIRDGSSQALALLWAGLVDEAKRYVLWYAERVYPNGLVPPILNLDGSVNEGYGSNIEFDAQGEFVGIAAEIYRVTRDRTFLAAIFEPVVRATRFIATLRAKTNAVHGPETRFYGLVAPSISHEGYSKPSFSYWDDFFALSALRNCEYLAAEFGDEATATYAKATGEDFAKTLTRSLRMTSDRMGTGLVPGSADRDDVDPTATAIAFEPCRVDDVLPQDLVAATYARSADQIIKLADTPGLIENFSPYIVRNINAFVALGRIDDAFRLLSIVLASRRPQGWRGWAEVVWGVMRAPEYIGDMPHTWIGAEFATAVRRMLLREDGETLELFRAVPGAWWDGEGITLRDLPTAFGIADLRARRTAAGLIVDLSLSGPLPERIMTRYPNIKQAEADGVPCRVDGDVVSTRPFTQLVIRG